MAVRTKQGHARRASDALRAAPHEAGTSPEKFDGERSGEILRSTSNGPPQVHDISRPGSLR